VTLRLYVRFGNSMERWSCCKRGEELKSVNEVDIKKLFLCSLAAIVRINELHWFACYKLANGFVIFISNELIIIVRECDLWFICFSSSIDDVYFLSAAVHCGPGTLLVSRDMFGNHISRMDLWMKIQFRRWQRLHQMVPERFIGDNPVFFVCTNILLFDFDRSQPSFSKK